MLSITCSLKRCARSSTHCFNLIQSATAAIYRVHACKRQKAKDLIMLSPLSRSSLRGKGNSCARNTMRNEKTDCERSAREYILYISKWITKSQVQIAPPYKRTTHTYKVISSHSGKLKSH